MIIFYIDSKNQKSYQPVDTHTRSSSAEIISVNFKAGIDENLTELDSMFYALHWIRTLGFYDGNGKGLDTVGGEIKECELIFSNNPFTANYEYKNEIEVEVCSKRGQDTEVFKLNKDDFQKYSIKIKPKKVSGNGDVTRNNSTLEYTTNDKICATFRNSENPKLVLDTLVARFSIISDASPIINDRIGKEVFSLERIHIFPNPVHKSDDKVINFSLETPLKIISAEISIFDALGNHIIEIPKSNLLQDNGNFHLGSWSLMTQTGQQIYSGSYLAVFTITYREGPKSRFERIIGIER